MYKSNTGISTTGKKDHIGNIFDRINEKRLEEIFKEVHYKESWAIKTAENGKIFDKTHTEMVLDFVRDNRTPIRPKTLNKLMVQFISSAFSYNRIRRQLRRINREVFHDDNYPIREDHMRILSYLLNDDRFLDNDFWYPLRFDYLI